MQIAPERGERLMAVDLLKAVSMLYIVGFWHMLGYTALRSPVTRIDQVANVTTLALGLFTLMAGYLTPSAKFRNGSDILLYYRRRAVRIYIPFIGCAALFAISHLSRIVPIIKVVLLASIFIGDAPQTLWYMDLICICYLVAPPLMQFAGTWQFTACAVALAVMFAGLIAVLPGYDPRMALYFPCFAIGIALKKGFPFGRVTFGLLCTAAAIGGLALAWHLPNRQVQNSLLALPWIVASTCAVFTWTGLAMDRFGSAFAKSGLGAIVVQISEASFYAYLLHRLIYTTVTKYIFMPQGGVAQAFYLAAICVFVILPVAWMAGTGYRKFVLARLREPSGVRTRHHGKKSA